MGWNIIAIFRAMFAIFISVLAVKVMHPIYNPLVEQLGPRFSTGITIGIWLILFLIMFLIPIDSIIGKPKDESLGGKFN